MPKLAKAQSDVLKREQIDESGPGTILRDFQMLLDFVGTGGIKTGGKNHRLPLVALGELDERMSQPLRPRKSRPQQLSYPHLNGLYLLLRTSGLGVSSGEGNSGLLSVHPQRLAEWQALNAEERYFTLLQTMLASDWSPIESGHRSGPSTELEWAFGARRMIRQRLTRAGLPASGFFWSWRQQTTAALLELFGMLEIPRVLPKEGESWRITNVSATEFGKAVRSRLHDEHGSSLIFDITCGRTAEDGEWLGDLFRDWYPNCLNTLPEQSGEFVEGIWQFKVSLGNVWRRIVIPADSNAEELACGILSAFRFDSDHLYELRLRDRSGRNLTIVHPYCEDAEYWTDEFAIGSLPLDPGQSMTFLYDFGDNWQFTVKLEKILPDDGKIKKMKIIEKKGKAPKQYGDYSEGGDFW
jgi:hypothetical protein